jgi:transposase
VAAVANGKPHAPRVLKPVAEHGLPFAGSVSPKSRKGLRSPHAQGREENRMFVGIDVSKDRLDVHLCPGGEAFAVPRDGDGLADLLGRLEALPVELVVLEATGGFETVVAAALAAARLPLAVVNPRQIRDFARATGRLAKTDALDAAIIARFAEAVRPEPRPVPSEEAMALGELVARRRQIVETMTAERNRRRHLTQARLLRGVDRVLAVLQAQLSEIESDIDGAIRQTPAWREREELLKSVPGIGSAIARTLIAELPELGSLDRRKIASLVGLAPMNRDSGTLRGRRTIMGGRATVRSALFMSMMVTIRHKLPLYAAYDRLRQLGKPPKVAIVACMRKLLTIANAIIRDSTPWQSA